MITDFIDGKTSDHKTNRKWAVVDLRPESEELHVIPHPDDWHEYMADCWCKPRPAREDRCVVVIHEEAEA